LGHGVSLISMIAKVKDVVKSRDELMRGSRAIGWRGAYW
jgi:hypothetical protein